MSSAIGCPHALFIHFTAGRTGQSVLETVKYLQTIADVSTRARFAVDFYRHLARYNRGTGVACLFSCSDAPSERSKGLFGGEDTQFIGAVLLASGWIMAWVYQTGSKRLGVVDLFACEIVTLCRVGTIMDVVPRLITAHQNLTTSARGEAHNASGQDINFGRFISQENYFPVFDGNSRDLQILEADVVINVTAFYTYMKVLRDHFRRLGELSPGQDTNTQKGTLLVNAIYMAFLAYESARTSIEELIEFEPTQAEALVTGLVTELSAYRYLTKCFGPEDIRGRRLALREKKYEELVPKLYEGVMKATGVEWENAQSTGIDLERLYNSLEFKPKSMPSPQVLPQHRKVDYKKLNRHDV